MKQFTKLFVGIGILFVIVGVVILTIPGLVFFEVQSKQEVTPLQTVELENEILTFYHNPLLMNNDGLYFTDQHGTQYTYLFPIIENKHTNQMIYVDFFNTEQVFNEYNEVIQPTETFSFSLNDMNRAISIYVLNGSLENYWLMDEGRNEIDVMTCFSSADYRSVTCQIATHLDPKTLFNMMDSWLSLSLDECPIHHTDMAQIASIEFNKHRILEGHRTIAIKTRVVDNITYVATEESTTAYYKLTAEQAQQLEDYFK